MWRVSLAGTAFLSDALVKISQDSAESNMFQPQYESEWECAMIILSSLRIQVENIFEHQQYRSFLLILDWIGLSTCIHHRGREFRKKTVRTIWESVPSGMSFSQNTNGNGRSRVSDMKVDGGRMQYLNRQSRESASPLLILLKLNSWRAKWVSGTLRIAFRAAMIIFRSQVVQHTKPNQTVAMRQLRTGKTAD